jgi:GNAT superfamily N-acetyltransferase
MGTPIVGEIRDLDIENDGELNDVLGIHFTMPSEWNDAGQVFSRNEFAEMRSSFRDQFRKGRAVGSLFFKIFSRAPREVSAFLWLELRKHETETICVVCSIWVSPALRRAGLASYLWSLSEAWCSDRYVSCLLQRVSKKNYWLRAHYVKEGWVEGGQDEGGFVEMKRMLAPPNQASLLTN